MYVIYLIYHESHLIVISLLLLFLFYLSFIVIIMLRRVWIYIHRICALEVNKLLLLLVVVRSRKWGRFNRLFVNKAIKWTFFRPLGCHVYSHVTLLCIVWVWLCLISLKGNYRYQKFFFLNNLWYSHTQ